ncbi:CHASE2 domain-containing protein [Thermodesulfovibrio yellowstonii]|uniref:CHASE2 domain-containing protein n=1 Tax=Thermodesulfovibrio yellowstonii TaxID=28262 RepID=UPI003C7C5BBD
MDINKLIQLLRAQKNKETIVSVFIVIIFLVLFYIKPYPFELVDMKIYDLFFHLRGQETPPKSVVIAAIDEASLEKFGRWPWSRDKIAKVIDKLSELEAAVITFDIILSEHEQNDRVLADSISKAGNVILPVVFFFNENTPEELTIISSAFPVLNTQNFKRYHPISSKNVLACQKILAENAAGFGHINMFPDPDGTIRWEVLFIEYYGYMIPSLSLKTVSMYLGIPPEKQAIDANRGVYLGKRYIPTDPWGRFLIPYYGGNETFKHISIVDILEDKVKKEDIENKIVIVGATAVGIYDLRVTPLSSVLPGVEKHANVVAAIIDGKTLLPASSFLVSLLIFLSGIISILFYKKLKAGYSMIVLMSLLVIVFSISFVFFKNGIWLSIVYISGNLVTQFLTTITIKYAYSEKEARQIKKIFSSYVTEKIVNELIKNPSMAKLGGARREVTVLFSDIRDFTTLSEKLPPEKVVEILNEYFSTMAEIIFKWEGTLDKFMGDAIMVFWGAPLPQNDHPEKALKCAIEMISKLRYLHSKWKAENKPLLKIGIGISTGEVLVGNIGAEGKKMDYTVIGDHVNLACRLEKLNKQFDSEILISEFTYERMKETIDSEYLDSIYVEELGTILVKGKETPVKIFKVSLR